MLKSVQGIFRDGKVELLEPPPPSSEGPVLVTFLQPAAQDLAQRGINPTQAADLRARLSTFADDWNRPEMDVYDEL